MYCNIPCNKADCNLRYNLIIVECIRVCCCVCRYVRFLQTKGKESFKIHLESCSYVGPVPYHFRERGVAGIIVNHTHCALFIVDNIHQETNFVARDIQCMYDRAGKNIIAILSSV